MAKVLAKIARRNNGNELPRRNELVETELFDTDRNPWSPEGGGGDELWERHDYDLACPYYPPWDPDGYAWGHEVLGPIPLVVERTSFAFAFVGGTFDVLTRAFGGFATTGISLQCAPPPGADWNTQVAAGDFPNFVSTGEGYTMNSDGGGWGYSVLLPGTYQVRLWAYCWSDVAPHTVVKFTRMAATIALLPAGFNPTSGWGGVLG
jgi:hypothetical protein